MTFLCPIRTLPVYLVRGLVRYNDDVNKRFHNVLPKQQFPVPEQRDRTKTAYRTRVQGSVDRRVREEFELQEEEEEEKKEERKDRGSSRGKRDETWREFVNAKGYDGDECSIDEKNCAVSEPPLNFGRLRSLGGRLDFNIWTLLFKK